MGRDDGLSDSEVAVMCDIARASGFDLDANKQAIVESLIGRGLVAATGRTEPHPKFEVTDQGQHLLDERGVGVNES